MDYYAGIGSRQTPNQIQKVFTRLGCWLGKKGYCLRSGAASGADASFEQGCDLVGGNKEIFLPWKDFNDSNSTLYLGNTKNDKDASKIASKYHPRWNSLKYGAKKLITRDVYQVLGENLNTPVKFIICYTKDGEISGGTGEALRIAKAYGIPVINAGKYCSYENEFLFDEDSFKKDFNKLFEDLRNDANDN